MKNDGDGCGLRFECTQCGKCCTNRDEYAHVYVSRAETKALAEHEHMTVSAFKRRYTFVDGDGWRQLRLSGEHCVFFDPGTKNCRVYAARPAQCHTFPFWRDMVVDGEWTKEARDLCEGVGRGRLYTLEEAYARMLEMEASEEG